MVWRQLAQGHNRTAASGQSVASWRVNHWGQRHVMFRKDGFGISKIHRWLLTVTIAFSSNRLPISLCSIFQQPLIHLRQFVQANTKYGWCRCEAVCGRPYLKNNFGEVLIKFHSTSKRIPDASRLVVPSNPAVRCEMPLHPASFMVQPSHHCCPNCPNAY